MSAENNDQRLAALRAWVHGQTGWDDPGQPVSSDASFRRYFRFSDDAGQQLVAMDAPPPGEDCRPFVAIDRLLADAGLHVPRIVAEDLARGFLLLSDLGARTYLEVFKARPDDTALPDALFADAIGALLQLQQINPPPGFPVYDEALLRRELALFPDWYLRRELRREPDADWLAAYEQLSRELIASALGQGQVLVHRDFMPRNLMQSEPNPGLLDFQDAVWGPIAYDPVCLFKDAFISWPEARVQGWLQDYWQAARARGLPVPASFAEFRRDCDRIGVHRHLKVIGIFARIAHRDGKPRYLADAPRFFSYLQGVRERYPEWTSLARVLAPLLHESA